MVTLGLVLVFFAGFSAVNLIANAINDAPRFSWAEQLGSAFPVGIGMQTLLMLLMDMVQIPLTRTNMIVSTSVLCVGLSVILLVKILHRPPYISSKTFSFKSYNLIWLLFIGLIVYFEYLNFAKCLYVPTFDRDSLAGFDTIGYVIAQEHNFKNISIFQSDYMPNIHNAGSYIAYTPLIQLSYAFVYLLGAETSKIIPALIFLSFLFMFYGSLKRVIGMTGAAIGTFFMLMTPEMIAFSSMSSTNVIHAVFAAGGIIYITLWLKYHEKKDLWLGTVLLGLNLLCRNEGLVFIMAALAVLFLCALKDKNWKSLLVLSLSLIPGLFWALFAKINGLYAESVTILRPFWDAEKAQTIWNYMKSHYTNLQFYGFTFAFLLISFVLNIWNLIKRKDNWALLVMFLIASILYVMILYHIEYKWDTIQNVLAYSAKRFLFCFVPLAWFWALSNQWMQWCWHKIDRFLS